MMSCVLLERPGKWRTVGASVLLLFAILPATPLLHHLLTSSSSVASVMTGVFPSALRHSLLLGGGVAAISFVVGLPLGVLAALYEFPARKILLALSPLPLLLPSFSPPFPSSLLFSPPPPLTSPPPIRKSLRICLRMAASPLPVFDLFKSCHRAARQVNQKIQGRNGYPFIICHPHPLFDSLALSPSAFAQGYGGLRKGGGDYGWALLKLPLPPPVAPKFALANEGGWERGGVRG